MKLKKQVIPIYNKMNILVTGANGQLGNEMRIISKESTDKYIFTDVNQVEGLETTYLDITDLDAIRTIVKENNVQAIVNCAGRMWMVQKILRNMRSLRSSTQQHQRILPRQ